MFGRDICLKGRLYTFLIFSAFKIHNSISLWVKITKKPNSIGHPSWCYAPQLGCALACATGVMAPTPLPPLPWSYHKIPKINPGAYIFQRLFLRGLVLEGLIFGGVYLRREICVSKSIGQQSLHFCNYPLALYLEGAI